VKGLEIIRRSFKVYLESYTSILSTAKADLESFYGKPLIEADRIFVESQCEQMLQESLTHEICFLVVGDPFGATTHADLFLRAQELGGQVGLTGLQLYKFGETVSVPFFTENWRPYSFFDKVLKNFERGLHTLVLLDIKVKEQSEEDLVRGRMVFQPPRFMRVNQAAQQILEAAQVKEDSALGQDLKVFAVLRAGTKDARILVRTLGEFANGDECGAPLQSMVIPGDLDEIEMTMMEFYRKKSLE
jgi:diphthine synthase